MKTFEEKFTAWVDGQLTGKELADFEASLPDKAAAEVEKREAKKLGSFLKHELALDRLSNAEFFRHQLHERIVRETAEQNRHSTSSTWWTLPRLVGNARALGLTLLGNKLPAEQAAAWGMIWQCVDDAELESTVQTLAEHFAAAPTRGLAATKAAIRGSWRHSLDEQLDIERDMQRELGRSADYAEGVAAFAGKRTPKFLGR